MPEIAVITACRPQESDSHLLNLWESLLAQRGVEWEWSICFDGPRESVPEFCDDPRVIVSMLPEPQGSSVCRNTAILACTSPILRNLDSGDFLISRDALLRAASAVQAWGAAVSTALIFYGPDDSRNTVAELSATGILPVGYAGDRWARTGDPALNAMTLSVNRDLYFRLGGYRAMTHAGDTALVVAINDAGQMYADPKPLSIYRQCPGQINAVMGADEGLSVDSVRRAVCAATGRNCLPTVTSLIGQLR